jgi:hypothetical protein
VFSVGSEPRLYNESLFAARRLENWDWKFRSCKGKDQENGDTVDYDKEYNRTGIGSSEIVQRMRMRIESIVDMK